MKELDLNRGKHFRDIVAGINPAPVDMENIPLFTGFQKHPKRLAAFLPSTVPGF